MRQRSEVLVVDTRRGLNEITPAVTTAVRAADVREGLCSLFIRHTSASLTVQENADPSARRDLEAWLNRLVPEGDALYHSLQVFALASDRLPYDEEFLTAALLHDVGKAINPQLLQGQIEGSVHMGLGYALTEDFICEEGEIQMQDINACGVLRAHHMPEIEVIIIEVPVLICPATT